MKHLTLEGGRIFTEARLKVAGEYRTIQVMIDTGSAKTILNEAITDNPVLDAFSIGPLKVSDYRAELQPMEADGIIGLDFLSKTGAKLNFDAMTISSSRT
ncbi:hypothetical protein [Alkalicoccus luteus]|uniref:Aspartyl protease n=1 Tax=Alkalicoccus luteus TaxID=1237094 RepID=A0A969TT46_9BACI|nr:hypothetical protein [Alkalicoccus luteus]NJP37268.1 hypothetical protein [Alkalicoccus luteus]